MKTPDAYLYPDASRELARETLLFLDKTDQFFQDFLAVDLSGDMGSSFSQGAQEHLEAAREEVNACLRLIGGLAVRYEDPENNRTMMCIVDQWLGYERDGERRPLWRLVTGMPLPAPQAGPCPIPTISLGMDTVLATYANKL